ncbi:hypothetical protein B0H99_105167 [Planomicrobium soli]|uniref:Uncharacterized protein n=1 Tax=Planomicrobium soli TaxID=1176648 RepID=A0A2P8H2E3_9BACL|nr:hypothetical protein B0H99_105167 [Planomicrobium soli]
MERGKDFFRLLKKEGIRFLAARVDGIVVVIIIIVSLLIGTIGMGVHLHLF